VYALAPADDFDVANRVAAQVHVIRGDGDYQILSLTRDDIAELLPYLVTQGSSSAKTSAATIALNDLDDKQLNEFLEDLFVDRRAKR
jgi:hypothetical protein